MERLTRKSNVFPNEYRVIFNSENDTLENTIAAVNKLGEYEDAEEQGLLKKLPCKTGDTVWVLRKGGYNLTGPHRGWDYYVDKIRFNYHALDLYGEFYTTREAAEQALKEVQYDQN